MAKIVYVSTRPSQYDFLRSIPFYYRPEPESRPKHFEVYAGEGTDVKEIQSDRTKVPRLYYRGEYRPDVAKLTRQGLHTRLGQALESGDLEAAHGTMTEVMTDVFREATSEDQKDGGGFDALGSIVDLFLTSCLDDRVALQSLATMENRNLSLPIHGCRVAAYAAMFANYHGLSRDDTHPLCMAGLLADVGKVDIPESIILAESRLEDDSDDLARLQAHPLIGAGILYAGGLDDMFTLAGVREHHERQDGSGYPQGLTNFTERNGVKIGEVIAIADCIDLLAHDDRPAYRPAVGIDGALVTLDTEAGQGLFDPKVHSAIVQGINGEIAP